MQQPAPRHDQIRRLLDALNQDLFEKETVVGLALLSAIAGESIFLLGPPGVAKSMVARRLKFAFEDAKAFEYLMGKFSTPDEVFGPVSIKKLKDEDRYERLVEHYLPGAQIVFLDEIWKASPPIQNALLTVLNEKLYRNGAQEIEVDLRGLIAASNELPLAGEGLEALWDRFLIRLIVDGISEEEQFNAMITLSGGNAQADPVAPSLKITEETYRAWSEGLDYTFIPPHILGVIGGLRKRITAYNTDAEDEDFMYVSDRRWRKIIRLLRSSAFMHDRQEVDISDCFLIQHCLWDKPEQLPVIRNMLLETFEKEGYHGIVSLKAVDQELGRITEEIEQTVKSVSVEEKVQAKPFTDSQGNVYVQLVDFWKDGAVYLRTDDLKRLKSDTNTLVPVLEKTGNQYRTFQTYALRKIDNTHIANKEKTISLLTETVSEEIVMEQMPEPEAVARWSRELEALEKRCERDLQVLEGRRERDIASARGHLFVPHAEAAFIGKSIDQALKDITQAQLEIARARHRYESAKPNG
ncbi:MAG: AAA family ATPase [Bacteroidia bacterium]